MPVPPSTYVSGPVSPQQLDGDLYAYDGASGLNGIAFHSQKPILSETVTASGTYSSGAIQQPVESATTGAFSVIDTSALTSIGADYPGSNAQFRMGNRVPGSSGAAGGVGGWWWHWNFPYTQSVTVPPGAVGAGLMTQAGIAAPVWVSSGVFQAGGTAHNNCPYFLDLVDPGTGALAYQPAFWWFTPSVPVIAANGTTTSGQTARNGWAWQCVSTGGGMVAAVPAPTMDWGTVTSANLNNLGSALTLLNNPPSLRVAGFSSQGIPDTTNTIIQLQLPVNISLDNYAGWSTALSNYAAPLTGLYLASPLVGWGTASSSGDRWSGLTVNAGGTMYSYAGPAYVATSVAAVGAPSACTASVRVLSLNAGDKTAFYGFQSSGTTLDLNPVINTRLSMSFMSPLAAAGTVLNYLPPDPAFRFRAGTLSGPALLAALNQHLGQDIAFLLNRPYFTGYQATAQTGFASDSGFHQVTIDTVGALPRGGNGDNAGGWNASGHQYIAQVPGWYLVLFEGFASPPAAVTATLTAGIHVSSSGGISPVNSPDSYQQVPYPLASGSPSPGAVAIGLYYLLAGESVYPSLQARNWGSTWGTTVQTGANLINSQFSVFWMCE